MPEAHLKGKVSLNPNPFGAGLKKAEKMAIGFASSVGGKLKSFITGPLGLLGGALAGITAFAGLKNGITDAIKYGASLEMLSKQGGIAVEQLSTLSELFDDAGVAAELVTPSINKMQRQIFMAAKGSGPFAQVLSLMEMKLSDIKDLSADKQFVAIGTAINELPDAAARAAASMIAFGKSGAALLPVFTRLKDANFANLADRAEALRDAAMDFREISILFENAADNLQNVFIGMASELAPQIKALGEILNKPSGLAIGRGIGRAFAEITNFAIGLASNGENIVKLLKATGNIWRELLKAQVSLLGIFPIAGAMLEKLISGMGGILGSVMGGGALGKILTPLGEAFASIGTVIKDYMKDAFKGVGGAMSEFGDLMKDITKQGREVLPQMIAPMEVKRQGAWALQSASYGSLKSGSLSTPSMATWSGVKGVSEGYKTSNMSSAYGQSSLLSARERRKFMEEGVASGTQKYPGLREYHHGDKRRREAFLKEQERKQHGVEKSNEILGNILDVTRQVIAE